ncbi:uncharacterized protein J4E78_000198 [Alternaria triticimaculans]|uniref:uncharacterized protein n=1 Tax=Alternaria triticimaculans TaxID=297637 RepID=UPI0020C4D3C5|nr:uncharacterized protein J4E78_000198 [Alternaria triticimaculans]KAI4671702.1 hypothetical protein J4E78_000198 [Alternaria triticimaculans]
MSLKAADESETSVRVLKSTLFDECKKIYTGVERLLERTNIEGMTEPQLKSAYEDVVKILDQFTDAIQICDVHIHKLKTTILIDLTEPRSILFLQEKWNKALIDKYLKSLRQLHSLERKLRYAKEGKELFALPDYDTTAYIPARPDHDMECTGRTFVIARMLWLMKKAERNLDTFPARGYPRYIRQGTWQDDPAKQCLTLPQDKKWMLASCEHELICLPSSEEWSALFLHIGHLTILEWKSLGETSAHTIESGMDMGDMKYVQGFTERATDEAVETGFEECEICGRSFSDQIERDDVEPAVKMICGHYIGEQCLQAWVNTLAANNEEMDASCPMCRTKLCIGAFPPKIRDQVFEFVDFVRNDPAFDREVDRFLLSATEGDVRQCYGPELGVMLAKLSVKINEGEKMLNSIVDSIDKLRG